jgi:hypothetical protein
MNMSMNTPPFRAPFPFPLLLLLAVAGFVAYGCVGHIFVLIYVNPHRQWIFYILCAVTIFSRACQSEQMAHSTQSAQSQNGTKNFLHLKHTKKAQAKYGDSCFINQN